ncbi:hypothetical protein CDL12_03656 [Handroanthus impetiginosus]|uniref:DUF7722 domain-containing protein n=1 Tax=Handroanthus impetiginosus TaxID=429701 RepID=A0A2G9I1H9_9LAMI|nr:hypothetical protein CDL12_03656 [Handroanthus impetiginosus]
MTTGTGAACPNSSACAAVNGGMKQNGHHQNHTTAATLNNSSKGCDFKMPLHYPRYKKSDYENMPEWQLDRLLGEYGLPIAGDIHQKRKFAMGAFLWPNQL